MNKREHMLQQIIQKIQVFGGLDENEVGRILRSCTPRKLDAQERLYHAGELSEDIFILLEGKLAVTGKSGETLGEIDPGSCTGEMGALTGQPRSADVTAVVESKGVIIHRQVLEALMREDLRLQVKILRNLLSLLSRRLIGANVSIETYAKR